MTPRICPECHGPMAGVDSGHYVCAACRAADRAEQDAILTESQALARVIGGGFVYDDELPDSMRGFGVPSHFRAVALTRAVPVLRISELPMPETLAYVRERYGACAVVVVEPDADDLREQHYDRFVGDERC